MVLLSNLPKSRYHQLWCRDNPVTKSVKQPIPTIVIPSIVMQRWSCYQICQRANTNNCDARMVLLSNLPKSRYHQLWCRDDPVTKSVKEPIPSIVMQGWCCYQICQKSDTIHCDAEMILLPNLSKSQYHPLWFRDDVTHAAKEPILIPSIVFPLCCRDDAVTKSVKEQIPSFVMQQWLPKSQYHPLWCRDDCKKANIIHCDAEMMLLPNLQKSKYHPLWWRDDAVTKSAKEQIPSIVMQRGCYYHICLKPISSNVIQRWCCYQICQRANIIHCDAERMLLSYLPKANINQCDTEMMLLPNLPKSKYHTMWWRDDAITKSAEEQIPSIVIQR